MLNPRRVFLARLWWPPLGTRPEAELVRKHPERLLLNADGSKQKISFFHDWYLCPTDADVVEYHCKLVDKISASGVSTG